MVARSSGTPPKTPAIDRDAIRDLARLLDETGLTAYLGPSPGARPFVDVGSEVKAGETLMIIEAMKTMNQIPAPRPGTVIQILIEDGQPVEYSEPLMIIE